MKKNKKIEGSRPNKSNDDETEAFTLLQKLIDSIPIPVFYKDIQGVYLGGNREFENF